MTVRTKTHTLVGDWRSGAYGANRRAHLWVYRMMDSNKTPACGARLNRQTTGRVDRRDLADLCYDCLAYTGSLR
jgi:hypothetical protein